MDRFQSMQVFVAAADSGSFAAAGRELNMSPPTVTRAISSLEATLKTKLFLRTTRSINLTEVGTRYLEDCRHILSALEEAEATAEGAHSRPTGNLTITASVLFGTKYVMPILTRYLDLHPDVTGRALLVDRVTDMIDEGLDVAVRIGAMADSSMLATRVGTVRRVVCASPEYLENNPPLKILDDLKNHRLIAVTGNWSSPQWRFGARSKRSVPVVPRLFCTSNQAAINAAIEGWGIVQVLSYQVGAELQDGRLQRVLEEFEGEPLPVQIVHPHGRTPAARIRSFVDFAAGELRQNPMINT